jgi:NAD(P) transhydrogenase
LPQPCSASIVAQPRSPSGRGQIIGDNTGLLKLIFHLDTRELLGVHILGEGASELVHIGQAVMTFGGKVDYFVDTVFNYPNPCRVLQDGRL